MTERGDGYCPQPGMRYFQCSRCGGETFKSYPQGVNMGSEIWTYEFVCAGCGQVMGLTEIRMKGGRE